jgi:phage recombination protein Bet
LDPLRRQIYAFVFNKQDPKKRQMTIVTSIAGYRAIADRTGAYRPGPTEVMTDVTMADPATNPRGISHAIATVYKHSHGEWHEVTETAYWEEFAPLKEVWQDNQPTGKFVLDPKKDGWRRMPRVMIEKCAEAKALRRAWPDDFAGLAMEDEMDRAFTIDATATELADAAAAEKRLELIGGGNKLTIDWCDGAGNVREPIGTFGDKAIKYIRENPAMAAEFAERNEGNLREYWAYDKSGALAVKVEIDKAKTTAAVQEAAE